MVDKFAAPFGTYTSVQATSANAKTELRANIASCALLFGITIAAGVATETPSTAAVPDFNKISPQIRHRLARELVAMDAAIAAMP